MFFLFFFKDQIPHLTKEKKPTVTFSWNVFPHSSSRSMLAIWCRPNQASFDASPWHKCGMQRCARWCLDLKKQLRRREKSLVDSRGSNDVFMAMSLKLGDMLGLLWVLTLFDNSM